MTQSTNMISSFERHIGTNYVPSMEEVASVKKFVDACSKEVDEIADEITRLQKQLQNLQDKKSDVCMVLDQHRALISPARRISRDVLEEIFLACLSEGRNPCVIGMEAPLLLTRICSSWRSIALSLPRLWSAIHIVLPSISLDEDGHILSEENVIRGKLQRLEVVARQWLAHSAKCPLSISIVQSPDQGSMSLRAPPDLTEKEAQLHIPFLTNIFAPYSNRWIEFDFCLPPFLLERLFERHMQSVTVLKRLHITARDVRGSSAFHRQFRFRSRLQAVQQYISDSTKLTSLTVRGDSFQASELSAVPITVWRHLTELNLELRFHRSDITLEFIAVDLLCHCRHLKMLTMNVAPKNDPWPNNIGLISLPSLTSLSLILGNSSPKLSGFFCLLQLPSLKNLDVVYSGNQREGPDFHTSLQALLNNAGHGLEYLGLYCASSLFDRSERSIVRCLQMTPNLKHLKLSSLTTYYVQERWQETTSTSWTHVRGMPYNSDGDYISDDLLNALSPVGKDYSEILCPELEILDCDHFKTGISSTALKECVRARQQTHQLDNRIAELSEVRVYVYEYRKLNQVVDDEKVLLGERSAVYFRKKLERKTYNPQEGFLDRSNGQPATNDLYFEVYKDL